MTYRSYILPKVFVEKECTVKVKTYKLKVYITR